MPATTRAPSGKRYTPHFCLTFSEKDHPLVLALKSILGGSITYRPDNHAYVLTISSLKALSYVVSLINGLLRTPKIYKFHALIEWLNATKNMNYPILPVDDSPLFENAWLSGFFDADGSFDVKVRSKNDNGSGKNRVEIRIRLEQRIIDPYTGISYFGVMQSIALALNVKLNNSKHHTREYYIVSSTSPQKLGLFQNYIDKYPLFTSKGMNYFSWRETYLIMLNNNHHTENGRREIQIIKDSINIKRVNFD